MLKKSRTEAKQAAQVHKAAEKTRGKPNRLNAGITVVAAASALHILVMMAEDSA